MSLNSIFNSLWNMDLTFIVNFLLVTFSLLTILGLLLIFLDYMYMIQYNIHYFQLLFRANPPRSI